MTDLTEQWKKGKLPEGDYYIKRRNGFLPYDNIDSSGVWRNSIDEDIIEVLAKVPSYEELQNQAFILKSRESEIAKLKELLHENRQKMFEAEKNYGFDDSIIEILTPQMDKIDKLLGEE